MTRPRDGLRLRIEPDDLASASMRALVALHLEAMLASTPKEHAFALGAADLVQPGILLLAARIGSRRVGMAALRDLGAGLGEVKSMRTHPDYLRRGVAGTLLEALLQEALRRRMTRVALETGRGPAFEPALALYRRFGFRECPPFGPYAPSPYNQFLDLELGGPGAGRPGDAS